MILLPAYRENRQSHCYLCAEYSVSSLPILMIFIANHLDKSCLRGNETALPVEVTGVRGGAKKNGRVNLKFDGS
ncbi:hypothetical protein NIES21_15030 [Anabaenopsis circularis NIES-21]|uniref:Uncharacterized protein n=1 Tax=Anabaenopsis circularis NIES-21 TaxID=1085406 RepID=A0A1Z4GDU0_9CYAN|nr:hypothetical protein NIES21_15030 [Anabaenopsis circularis NIES-21]